MYFKYNTLKKKTALQTDVYLGKITKFLTSSGLFQIYINIYLHVMDNDTDKEDMDIPSCYLGIFLVNYLFPLLRGFVFIHTVLQ